MPSSPDIDRAADAIRTWGENRAWAGWDPYDALNSPFAPALTFGRPVGRRLLTQAVKTSPVNLRPLLRIPHERDPKGVALAASGYARLGSAREDESAAVAAIHLLDWLLEHPAPSNTGLGWAYHFDVQTRFFHYTRRTPNVIATAFVAHALLDAVRYLGETRFGDPVREVVAFLVNDLLLAGPAPHFRYVDEESALIHNANLLACSVLARSAQLLDDPALAEPAVAPLRTTLDAQAEDGSWPYSDRPGSDWVDNFHTGYALESLATCADLAPDAPERLLRGVEFWERALFLPDGTPRATSTRDLPYDSHSYAQAVETWLAVAPWRPHAVRHATHVAQLLATRMLAPEGHVYFEQRRFWLNRIPFVRWTTAAAFRAFARLLLAESASAKAPATEAAGAHLG